MIKRNTIVNKEKTRKKSGITGMPRAGLEPGT